MSEYYVPEIDKNEDIRGLTQQYVHIEKLGAFPNLNCKKHISW